MISIDSDDLGWAFAPAYFAGELRGEQELGYGDVLSADTPIAKDTEMDALLIFSPRIRHARSEAFAHHLARATYTQ